MNDTDVLNITNLGIIFDAITLSIINNQTLNPGARVVYKGTASIEFSSPELVDFVTNQNHKYAQQAHSQSS